MNQKITSVVKKSVKVGAAVCVALRALTIGGKCLKDAVRKIIGDSPEENVSVAEAGEKRPAAEPVEDTSVN